MLLVKKGLIFLYLDLVEIRLEIRLINFVEKKQTILTLTKNFFKNRIFSKRLTHAFNKKMSVFSLFVFSQNKTRNKV